MTFAPPRISGRTWRICRTAILFLLARASGASAQAGADSLVPAGAEYQYRGTFRGVQQWFYGHRYRSLWAVPVAAPGVSARLDAITGVPDTTARLGGVWLWTPDGLLWEYRALDRDIVAATPPPIRDNLLPSVIQGLNAARHPGAPPVVVELAAATDALVPPAQLVRLVDSVATPGGMGRLGYLYRAEFAGFTTVELLDSLRRDGGRAFDARAYLRERLFDTYLGHWDDAPGEWRWQRTDAAAPWSPEPRDRDRAFSRYDGLLADIARKRVPGFVSFGQGYQSQLGVMPYQRTLDRQLLSLLDWPVWDSLAGALQAVLTDSVIDAAVSALPPEYLALDREPLTTGLRARRDSLRVAAKRLYRLINQEAAFFGSPGADTVTVTRHADGSFELAFRGGLHRRYAPEETDAVALYLEGGADLVELVGPGNVGPLLDLAWAPGLTVTGARRSGQRATLYGGGPRTGKLRMELVSDTLPVPDVQDLDLLRPTPVPIHGSDAEMVTWFDVNSDVGVLIGGGVAITTYRLGHDPFYRKLRIRAGYATAVGDYAVEVHGDFHRWRSNAGLTLDAGISEILVLHFFGYGNTTPFNQPISYYLARQKQLYLYPAWNYQMTPHTLVAVGPVFKHVTTDTVGSHLINDSRPYGVPEFAQAGLLATATYDTRDSPQFTRRGWRIVAGGAAYPVVFGAGSPFGTMQASAAWFVTLPSVSRLTLATRASVKLVMGDVPVHEAAFVGGSNTVRGYEAGRYAGESSAYLNGELRAHLATFPAVVPWQFGVMGLADLGRVFNETDDTNVWHGSAGGGVWFAMPDRSLGGVLTVAWSPQGSAIWLGIGGFMF
jgi:hypothetical protein